MGQGEFPADSPTGELWDDVIAHAPKDLDFDREFYDGWKKEGVPFTVWTLRRVYFPVVYDGRESVGSAPRFPCDEPTDHVGDG